MIAHIYNEYNAFEINICDKVSTKIRIDLNNIFLAPDTYNISLWIGFQGIRFAYHEKIMLLHVKADRNLLRNVNGYDKRSKTFIESNWEIL